MITTANYLMKVVANGDTYVFEYETPDVWTALEEFWYEDWSGSLPDTVEEPWPLDILAMDRGKVIISYRLAFEPTVFHHFYDHGDITLDQFHNAICKIRKELDNKKISTTD